MNTSFEKMRWAIFSRVVLTNENNETQLNEAHFRLLLSLSRHDGSKVVQEV